MPIPGPPSGPGSAPGPGAEGSTFLVSFELADGLKAIEVGRGEFILEAARSAGLDLPSLCEQGWCITCAVYVIEGQVDQSASRRFFPEDREAGFALICTGQPRSNLRLRPGATEAMRRHRDRLHLPVPRGTGRRVIRSASGPQRPG